MLKNFLFFWKWCHVMLCHCAESCSWITKAICHWPFSMGHLQMAMKETEWLRMTQKYYFCFQERDYESKKEILFTPSQFRIFWAASPIFGTASTIEQNKTKVCHLVKTKLQEAILVFIVVTWLLANSSDAKIAIFWSQGNFTTKNPLLRITWPLGVPIMRPKYSIQIANNMI